MGTTHDQAWIVRESESLGSPSSHACLRAFAHGWTRRAGWPKLVRCDRRTHNRCVLGSTLTKKWCSDQTCWIGSTRTNRKSGTTRCHAQKDDVESHQGHTRYRQRMDGHDSQRILERRHPAQWVLSRLPRNQATTGDEDECLDVGTLQAYADGPTTFGVQSHN